MNVFKKIAARGKYQDAYSIPALVDYIMNPVRESTILSEAITSTEMTLPKV